MNNVVNNKSNYLEKQNFAKDIITYIKQQILSGELNPGDRIIETMLAKELGISQTPVREAIRMLQGEGIITIVPNKGPMVCNLEMKDVFEIYSLRSVIEGLGIRLACQRATDQEMADLESFYNKMKTKLNDQSVIYLLDDSFQIHNTIINLSQHSQLIATYQSLLFKISLINRVLGTKKKKEDEIAEHWELIDAMKRRDPDYAEQTVRRHIFHSYNEFIGLNGMDANMRESGEKLWF
jgi:DNA-binding GntR family transcriptional regulator